MAERTLIIAEAGVNHNGSLDLAFELVDAGVAAGVDIVKFQTFKAEKLVTKTAEKADYQKDQTGAQESQFDMLKKLELSYDEFRQLADYCEKKGVEFLSTAFDTESLDFLVNTLGQKRLKVPSGEITNGPYLLAHAQTDCDIIMSTGMATLAEVETALGVLAFGYLQKTGAPSLEAFREAFSSEEGQAALKNKITLLHCTSQYPTPFEDVNLKAMDTMRDHFGLSTGYSDHTQGITVPIAAVARGAAMIEKHYTLDRTMEGPDHAASLEPDELKAMTGAIHEVEKSLGSPEKKPSPSETSTIKVARKSLIAAKAISKGQTLEPDDIAIMRPGTGASPMEYWSRTGMPADQNYREGDPLNASGETNDDN